LLRTTVLGKLSELTVVKQLMTRGLLGYIFEAYACEPPRYKGNYISATTTN